MSSSNPRCFIDVSIDGSPIGRIIFELFADRVPKTAENFRALCTGEKGSVHLNNSSTEVQLCYRGSPIHRIIPNFMIQGGDFTQRNGKGGLSIYESNAPFEDEDLTIPIDSQGLLIMANKGPNTNGSQWFITLRPCPHLDGKHVVFGRVVKGYEQVVERIAQVETGPKDAPLVPVIVEHCGELERRKVSEAATPGDNRSRAKARRSSTPSSMSDSGSMSDSPSDRDEHKRSSRSRRRRRSRSPDERNRHRDDIDDDRRHRHRHSTSRGDQRRQRHDRPSTNGQERQEEVIDEAEARRRTEEDERRRIERTRELEALKKRYERPHYSSSSRDRRDQGDDREQNAQVKYKGRGVMKAPSVFGQSRMRGWD